MLVIQTAFAQETAAILRAGKRLSDEAGLRFIEIANQRCAVMETGIGLAAASRSMRELFSRVNTPSLVLSIGLAGALQSSWPVGDWGLIDSVCREDGAERLVGAMDSLSLDTAFGTARRASLISLKKAALTSSVKRELSQFAQLCDMETHAVASECQRQQVRWVGVRIVSDAYDEEIKAWTMVLPDLMAQRRWFRMARLLATHPQDLPALVRLGFRLQALQRRLTQLTQDLVTHVQSA